MLTAPGETRAVLRAVVDEWCRSQREWDWLQLPTMCDQGWFEPEWLTGDVTEGGFVQHKITRPAVVLDLPTEISELQKRLKPNLRESLRRSRSRLNRAGTPWSVSIHAGEYAIRNALPTFEELHGARSRLAGDGESPRCARQSWSCELPRTVFPAMARAGTLQILSLDIGEVPVASQVVLLAPDTTYVYTSGLDPEWWHLSAVTFLQWHAAMGAVERRHASLNMSVGPDVAKLRWSEQIQQHPEFLVCGPRKSSHAKFTAYRMASAVAGIHREARRHRTTESRKDR